MSDEPLPEGHGAVNIGDIDKGARADIEKFAKDMVRAISNSGSSEADKKTITRALRDALQEANPKLESHSSQAKDAAAVHTDHKKINNLRSAESGNTELIGKVAGVAAVITGNPLAQAIAKEFAPDNLAAGREANFAKLTGLAKNCGIAMIGDPKVPLDGEHGALNKTKKNIETVAAVRSMRANGFNGDNIYGTHQQLNAGGQGPDGAKAFVVDCANRLANQKSGKTSQDKLEFLERPKPVSQQQRMIAEVATGEKLQTGLYRRDAERLGAVLQSEVSTDSDLVLDPETGKMVPRAQRDMRAAPGNTKKKVDPLAMLAPAPAPMG